MPTPSPPTRSPACRPQRPRPADAGTATRRCSGSWPGVAPPAGWFLHPAQSPPAAHQERTSAQDAPLGARDQPGQRSALRVPAPAPAPDTGFPFSNTAAEHRPTQARVGDAPARASRQVGPRQPEPHGTARPPAPGRTPAPCPRPPASRDGSWSSPLTPKPARQPLGPTQARYGRAGGPGFQPTRSDQAGPQDAGAEGPGLSPWQRSHQLWTEAGIEWERRPAPQLPWHPTASRSAARPGACTPGPRRGRPRHRSRSTRRGQSTRHGRSRRHPGQSRHKSRHQSKRQTRRQSRRLGWAPTPRSAGLSRTPVPLGAPVYSEPGVDEDDGPARDDRWGDDQPPIRQRPRRPGARGRAGRRIRRRTRQTRLWTATRCCSITACPAPAGTAPGGTAPAGTAPAAGPVGQPPPCRIAVPVIVVVAVAALALALLTGHGPKFGPAHVRPAQDAEHRRAAAAAGRGHLRHLSRASSSAGSSRSSTASSPSAARW